MLTSRQKKFLKARAHALKPVVITGAAGISPAVLAEIDRALQDHELIKVRVNTETAQERAVLAATVSARLNADTVQIVGHIVTLFREKPPKPAQPRPTPKQHARARYTGSSRSRIP